MNYFVLSQNVIHQFDNFDEAFNFVKKNTGSIFKAIEIVKIEE